MSGKDYLDFIDLSKFEGSLEDFYEMLSKVSDRDSSEIFIRFSDNFAEIYVLK